MFSRHPPCPSIVQCFFYTDNGIFLEYMRGATLARADSLYLLTASLDVSLWCRIQNNHIRDQQTSVITKVEKLEPLPLRKEWMNDLAQAVAFLESLNLAHGDLRPENILLDRDRLKVSDFDCTAEIGTDFEACMAPYGRILNNNEPDQGRRGSSGFLGPRTEQFALGSLFNLINYGFEVYGDRCLTKNPNEHGRKVVDLLQNMEFPELDRDPLIDDIINKCWHNKYATIAELAAYTDTLPEKPRRETKAEAKSVPEGCMGGLWNSFRSWALVLYRTEATPEVANDRQPDYSHDMGQDSSEDFSSKKAFCQSLDKRGLLHMLSLGEPEQLGFTTEWYRYSTS
ncbi:unnamed protein product [Penicillium olsonii]|nr:unnamed protein product [Penicillium olsonii]